MEWIWELEGVNVQDVEVDRLLVLKETAISAACTCNGRSVPAACTCNAMSNSSLLAAALYSVEPVCRYTDTSCCNAYGCTYILILVVCLVFCTCMPKGISRARQSVDGRNKRENEQPMFMCAYVCADVRRNTGCWSRFGLQSNCGDFNYADVNLSPRRVRNNITRTIRIPEQHKSKTRILICRFLFFYVARFAVFCDRCGLPVLTSFVGSVAQVKPKLFTARLFNERPCSCLEKHAATCLISH